MKLDTHLHVMLKPFYGRPPTNPEKLLADLAECGLDGGWVSTIDAMTTRNLIEQQLANDALAEIVQKYPARIAGLCTVNPECMEAAASEIERSVKHLGLIGVKLHPWLQAFSLMHPGVGLVMETAATLGVPVLFHDGTPPYSTPLQVAWLAARYPKCTVIMGHAGLADLWPDASMAAHEHSNIWLQPSAAPVQTIRAARKSVGAERILFGTDGGYGSSAFIRYGLNKYRAALGENELGRIMSENPKRLLSSACSSG